MLRERCREHERVARSPLGDGVLEEVRGLKPEGRCDIAELQVEVDEHSMTVRIDCGARWLTHML